MTQSPLARWGPLGLAVGLTLGAAAWLAPLGLALSPDGAHYMNVAFRMAHDGFGLFDPKYPIGYPLLVRLVMPVEPFPLNAALWVSLGSFAVSLAGVGALARRVSTHLAWPLAAILGCAFFVPFWNAHLYALSEAPFTALLVLHAVCVARHLESSRTEPRAGFGWFAVAAVCVGASVTVRVMGYALIASFTLYTAWWLVRSARDSGLRARAIGAHALCYVPAALLAGANLLAGRAVHGARPGAEKAEAFARNVELAGSTLGGDLGVALVSTLVASLFAFGVYQYRSRSSAEAPDTATDLYFYLVTVVVLYVPVLVIGASLTRISAIGTRFLVPIYPLVFVLALGVARFAPAPLRTIGAVLALLSFAHAAGIGAPELKRRAADVATIAGDTNATHLAVGFDASPGALALRSFLHEAAMGEDDASLSSLFPMPRGGQHARLARALLFRGTSVVEPDGTLEVELAKADMLALRFEPSGRRLRYYDLPITGQDRLDPQTLLRTVYDVMRERKLEEHWLLTARGGDPLAATGDLVAGPLQILERRAVGGYRAYHFAQRRVASATE